MLPCLVAMRAIEESRSAVNIMSTVISVALVLMMLGIVALALVFNFLR